MMNELLRVEDLHTHFDSDQGTVHAVDGASFGVDRGEIVGLVGESGCGKSVTARSIIRLEDPGRIVSGRISFDGRDLTHADEATLRRVRGEDISIVFQDPHETLNPVFPIGDQIAESVRIHDGGSSQGLLDFLGVPPFRNRTAWNRAEDRAVELMEQVAIPDPNGSAAEYPHEFSGGMRQRAMLAVALASDPDLLIADEPTTALDTTTQAGILRQIRTLRDQRDMGVLLISHDIGVVAQTCDRVVVMYGGQVMESGPVDEVLTAPKHPYTRALLECSPRNLGRDERVSTLEGSPPDAVGGHDGCPFADRCRLATSDCRSGDIPVVESDPGHRVACIETPTDSRGTPTVAASGQPRNVVAPDGGDEK
ncbi:MULTISPECIES: ABC transporter ATP-binding protein [unclassified Haloferax]|uniref:ABC transporter ATP-binding protein n=1 Tax=unclassified Haloferax TaxID=2625095 RepID=UPI000E262510|nr:MULTISPECIES: ABC transporter ATP-binding protein [unclassified Haloferax]RDZ33980.1 ABC transporter ATP-binding protein [Haloferax sp. Atlit-24N]RLM33586.1 ABC transporter ATP-binding protein [Haloferax sp. Atlit-109R]RLM40835.1 ABC transporter ATP-binding protein [Haloferax sp. Atlit-105R]